MQDRAGIAQLRIVVVTGIFPPDIGGPATHAAAVSAGLSARGHDVRVLTLTDARASHGRVTRLPRAWPWPLRLGLVASWIVARRQAYDVVYATGLQLPAVAGAVAARRPVVVKIVADAAWERARRLALTADDVSAFQSASGGPRVRLMRIVREWTVRHATAVVVPSAYLRRLVRQWSRGKAVPHLIRNGARTYEEAVGPGGEPEERPLRFVFVGRLIPVKRVDVILAALSRIPGAELDVIGSGPSAPELKRLARELGVAERTCFRGALAHQLALAAIASGDALVLASEVEGLPHVAIEALACGIPVIAPNVGGITEVIRDGVNGLVIPAPDAGHLVRALQRLVDNPALREQLARNALEEAADWHVDGTVRAVEELLVEVARGRGHCLT